MEDWDSRRRRIYQQEHKTYESDGVNYTYVCDEDRHTCWITNFDPNEDLTEITFPDKIPDNTDGYPVELIEGLGSYGPVVNDKLKKVTIPKSVKVIGSCSFYGYASLEDVIIPEGVEVIGHYAFYGCKALETITVPDTVDRIVEWAFGSCTALKEATIMGSIKADEFYRSIFGNCTSLKKINISNLDSLEVVKTAFLTLDRHLVWYSKITRPITVTLKTEGKEDISVTICNENDLEKYLVKESFQGKGIDCRKIHELEQSPEGNRKGNLKKKILGSAGIIVGGLSALAFIFFAPIVAAAVAAVGIGLLIAGIIAVDKAREDDNERRLLKALSEAKSDDDVEQIVEQTVDKDMLWREKFKKAKNAGSIDKAQEILRRPKLPNQGEVR